METAAQINPFTPSFGEVPLYLAGRQDVIADMVRGFESENRRPELTALFSGARGVGKTAMLSYLAETAEGLGWIAVNVTSLPGLLEDIELQASARAEHIIKSSQKVSVAEVGIPQLISVQLKDGDARQTNWRQRMSGLLDALAEHDVGLLITVDEIDPSLDEMVQLAAVYQHFVRENRRVSLLMAGLPHSISTLVNDKTVSFLRRAQLVQLGRIPDYEVETALIKTIESGGRKADADGVALAVDAIKGFAFLLQLVGYRSWDINPSREKISKSDFEQGIRIARREMENRILEVTFRGLSPGDIDFLKAMLADEGDSTIADITRRLGKASSQVGQYKRRLIDAGVIGQRRRGVVGFDLPFFREYLAEHV